MTEKKAGMVHERAETAPPTLEGAVIESIDFEIACEGPLFYCWLRLADGRAALWELALATPPGEGQRLRVVAGA